MKNITISILCAMIITTTAYCPENSDDQETKQKATAAFVQKILHSKKTPSKLDDKFVITSKQLNASEDSDNKKANTYSNDQENKRHFTFKEKAEFALAIAIFLFLIAKIKFDFFPSEEQKKLRAIKNSNVGITGMSPFSEYLVINQLCRSLR